MANIDLSIIIPSKNNKTKTADIIKKISEQTHELAIEYIVIDMNSSDGSVLDSLNMIKNRNLRGCVIQSGAGTVSSALNTGIFKAGGKYITFLYPTRLYKDYIADYYRAAEAKSADFVFAVPKNENGEGCKNPVPDGITGADIAVGLIRGSIVMDFTAVMFDREFLLRNHIRFYDECTFGYAEAFIYNALMYDPIIAHCDIALERDFVNGLSKDGGSGISNNCFERLDAMIKVKDTIRKCHKNDVVLLSYFEHSRLPAVVMSCVDRLLTQGFSYNSIRKLLKTKRYDQYLAITGETPAALKKKIMVWKYLPWLYKP